MQEPGDLGNAVKEEDKDQEAILPPLPGLLPKQLKNVLYGLGGLFVIGIILYGGYRYGSRGIKKLTSSLSSIRKPTPTSISSSQTPIPELTSDQGLNQGGDSGPSADWQAFTHSSQNYSIRVPPDWKYEVFRRDLRMGSWTFYSPPGVKAYPVEIGAGYIKQERKKGKSIKESAEYWLRYYLRSTTEPSDLDPFVRSEEDIVVGGANGTKYIIAFRKSKRQDIWIYFIRNEDDEYIYKVIARGLEGDLLNQFNLMLNTFEFVEPSMETPGDQGE